MSIAGAGRPRRRGRCRVVSGGPALAVAVVPLLLASSVGCGLVDGDDDTAAVERRLPAVEQIAPAVEAVETLLGGPQDYFEINADHRLVNLFVASDENRTATAYLVIDGEVQPPAPPQPVEAGATFTADLIEIDPDTVLTQVAEELPSTDLTTFVVLVGPTGALRYEVLARSEQGGLLAIELTADGAVAGVESL